MKNEQILENWHLQFKDQKKLNFEEAKELLKLASKETDELLKKQYYDKVILGTEHVIYEYLKNSKLYLLSSLFYSFSTLFDKITIVGPFQLLKFQFKNKKL